MDGRSEIREFLTSRRARLKVTDVGLPDNGARRVPGLRREEVAILAGVSVPYYARLERGEVDGVSDKRLNHPQVGEIELRYTGLDVVFDADLTIYAYTADPGSRSAEALALLGSLVATAAAEHPTPAQ